MKTDRTSSVIEKDKIDPKTGIIKKVDIIEQDELSFTSDDGKRKLSVLKDTVNGDSSKFATISLFTKENDSWVPEKKGNFKTSIRVNKNFDNIKNINDVISALKEERDIAYSTTPLIKASIKYVENSAKSLKREETSLLHAFMNIKNMGRSA